MVLLVDLVRLLLSFFLNELLGLFRYPPGSGRALLAGTLPLRYCAARFALLGGYLCLVMLLAWLPLIVRLLVVMGVRYLVQGFTGFVVLDRDGKEFDSTENPLHTLRVWVFNLGHVCGRDCVMWSFQLIHLLIFEGGVMISVMMGISCSEQDWGGLIPAFSAGPCL